MQRLSITLFVLIAGSCLLSCSPKPSLKEQVHLLNKEWGFVFPMPSDNDSINLLYIQMEESYFTLKPERMDSLAKRILSIDSTFYMALSFQAFKAWPFDLEKLMLAKKYASKDTSIHRLIFEGDYDYWVMHDTLAALRKYTTVYNRYPNSKIAAWLAGMASLWSKDYKMAIRYYKRSLEIDSTFYHAYYDLGDAYYEMKEYQGAIENYSRFLTNYPSKYKVHNMIGDAYAALNDSLNAQRHYHMASSASK